MTIDKFQQIFGNLFTDIGIILSSSKGKRLLYLDTKDNSITELDNEFIIAAYEALCIK